MTEQEKYFGDITDVDLVILEDLKECFATSINLYLSDVSDLLKSSEYEKISSETKINANFEVIFIKMISDLNTILKEKIIDGSVSFKQLLNAYKCLIETANESFDREIALYTARKNNKR